MDTRTAPLTATDRCDRCSAPAQVSADLWSGRLLFCGHHARRFADGLRAAGAVVVDHRPTSPVPR